MLDVGRRAWGKLFDWQAAPHCFERSDIQEYKERTVHDIISHISRMSHLQALQLACALCLVRKWQILLHFFSGRLFAHQEGMQYAGE